MTRTVLVTGAGGGIGAAVAERLLAGGYQVVVSARSKGQLETFPEGRAKTVVMDVGDDASVEEAFAGIDHLDAVVHCAAIAPLGTVEFTPPARVAEVFNVNTLGALRVSQRALPLLRKSASGRLVLVSSLWGRVSGPFVSSYAASKHAIEALADSLRRELGDRSVRVSVIEPGVVKTPMYFGQVTELDRKVEALSADERLLYGRLYADHRKLVTGAERTAISADDCAKVVQRCLDARRPKPRYRAGMDAGLMVTLGRTLTDRGLDRVFGLMYKG